MQSQVHSNLMTEEDYLALELNAGSNYEYIEGKRIYRPLEICVNVEIARNLTSMIYEQTEDLELKFFFHGKKLRLPDGNYFLPDLIISCHSPTKPENVIESPLVIAEILSKENRHLDMFDKFFSYKKIPTLLFFLIVEPIKKIVWLVEKDETGDWKTGVYDINDGHLFMKSLQLKIEIPAIFMSE
jgi:Uma2 family endonuclease